MNYRLSKKMPNSFFFALVFGYGLFRGVNSRSYLSAFASVEAPFLFVPDLFFNVIAALSVIVSAALVVALVYTEKLKSFSMPLCFPAVLLMGANACAWLGALSSIPADFALLVPAVLFGVGSLMLSLVWVELLATQRPSVIAMLVALSTLVGLIVSSTLSELSSGAQSIMSCLLLIVMVGCGLYSRRKITHPLIVAEGVPSFANYFSEGSKNSYKQAFLILGSSIIAFVVLESVVGLLNSFMITGSVAFTGSEVASIAGMLLGIFAFCVVAFVARRTPLVSTAFGTLVPIIAAMLVFLPFLGEEYSLFFSVVLLGVYYFAALLITYFVAVTARERRVSPYILMGVAACFARVGLAAALWGGYELGKLRIAVFGGPTDTMFFLTVVVVLVYMLSMAAVLITRWCRKDRRSKFVSTQNQQGVAESSDQAYAGEVLLDQVTADQSCTQVVPGQPCTGQATPSQLRTQTYLNPVSPKNEDIIELCCARVALEKGLTERESELLCYLARGRTKAYIAEALFVTENTVRSHVRNIYSKLGVHTRQELIDLVEEQRAKTQVRVD